MRFSPTDPFQRTVPEEARIELFFMLDGFIWDGQIRDGETLAGHPGPGVPGWLYPGTGRVSGGATLS